MAETSTPTTPPPPGPAPVIDPARWRRDVLIGAGIMLGVLVLGYFLLGREYYRSKLEDDLLLAGDEDLIAEAAWDATVATFFYAYLTFALVGTAALTSAMLWPRYVGHVLATAFGVIYLGSGATIISRGSMPPLVGVFQAVIGGVLLRLAWASWKHKDRAAWAFLLSLSAVLAGAMFFGAPRIKAAMNAPGLWYVLIVPFVLIAQAVALYRSRAEYA